LAGTRYTTHTETFGPQGIENSIIQCQAKGHAIFINGHWPHYSSLIPWLASRRLLGVIIAPIWEEHGWFESILSRSTHIWTLPSDACTPLQGIENSQDRRSTHKIIAAFADFRYEQSASISFDTLTSKEHCSWTLDHWSQPKILDSVSPILEEDCKSISPFKIGFIKETSLGAVPDTMRTEVLKS